MTDSFDHLHPTVRQYVNNPRIASEYDATFADNQLFHYDCEFIDEHLPTPGTVLDVGCGTGRHLTHLGARGFVTIGLDLSEHMLREAEENLRACGQVPRLIRADMHHLPLLPSARFDAILLMFSTLGLVQTEKRRIEIVATLRQHLAPGGVLVAHFHNLNFGRTFPTLKSLARRFTGNVREIEEGDNIMPSYRGLQDLFLHSFSLEEIRRLFAAAGCRLRELRPLNLARNGCYTGQNPNAEANGFLAAAESAQP
jgi:SAM-dependent methyltransferase